MRDTKQKCIFPVGSWIYQEKLKTCLKHCTQEGWRCDDEFICLYLNNTADTLEEKLMRTLIELSLE